MTTDARKAALDAILERIHIEGFEDYGGFATNAANWFAQKGPSEYAWPEFIDDFESHDDFFKYNQIESREAFLRDIFDDAVSAVKEKPSKHVERLFIDDIDSFEMVSDIKPGDVDRELPLDIPEEDVKNHLREIIGERFNQTDWAGERNDLFTNQVVVNGHRVDAAFMLKGPSVRGEMHISDAGKRGDQVQRLFESPAQLFVIQFNGKFEDRFIQHVKEQAQISQVEMYCLIDGTDTARILQAYDKI